MYSVVLMAALSAGTSTPAWFGGCHGCHACYGCYGACYGGNGACYGCYGAGYGCWGAWDYSGCWGYGNAYASCYGCYGGYGYGGYGWGGYGACYGCWGGSCYGCTGCDGGCYGGFGAFGAPAIVPDGTSPVLPGVDDGRDRGTRRNGDRSLAPARAKVIVQLPADAKLYIDDHLMKTTSAERVFSTPELEPGQLYYYMVRAEVVRDGKTRSDTKRILVRAGEEVRASFEEPKMEFAANK